MDDKPFKPLYFAWTFSLESAIDREAYFLSQGIFLGPLSMLVLLLLLSLIFIPSAVMDGIDLDIEGGDYKYYPEFITELRKLMDDDQTKSYLITGAPQCPFPDHHLGPVKPGTGKQRCIQWVFFGNLDGKIHWHKFYLFLSLYLKFRMAAKISPNRWIVKKILHKNTRKSSRGKKGLIFHLFREIFQWNGRKKSVFHLHSNLNYGNFLESAPW